ncbi:hypothetical protein MMPV_002187 [Pyropia vietnamensis]
MAGTTSRTFRVLAVAAAVAAVVASATAQVKVSLPAGATVAESNRDSAFTPPPSAPGGRRRGGGRGSSDGGRKPRIVGGREVDKFTPDAGVEFMAAIYTPSGGFYCGGSLIGTNHVLTRAGCNVQVGDVVRLGSDTLFGGLPSKVTKVINHPSFVAAGDLNDLAVLKLSNPGEAALVAAGALPITLDTSGANVHGHYIHGFGTTDKQALSAGSFQLKRGYQKRTPWAECAQVLSAIQVAPGVPLPFNPNTQVCTNLGSYTSGALCERDPGGAMFRVNTQTLNGVQVKVPIQYAVASYWVAVPGQKCPQGMPNVGTLVAPFASWIAAAKQA